MSVEIPAAILDALQPYESGCWSLESHGDTAFIVKLPNEGLEVAWNAKLLFRFELARDLAPCVVRLRVDIRGESQGAGLAVLWNGADERQRADLERLVNQDQIDFYFYDVGSKYHFTRRVGLPAAEANRSRDIVGLCGSYLASLPSPLRDAERERVQDLLDDRW